jgi:hypothetical protein
MRAEDQQVMIRAAPGRADRFSVGDADSFPRGFVWAKLLPSSVFRAEGAEFILSLGRRPRIRRIKISSAESAIHFRDHRCLERVRDRFRGRRCLGPGASHRIKSRFQRLATHISNPLGDAPGYDEIAPMALER